jgi:hypothetical protein
MRESPIDFNHLTALIVVGVITYALSFLIAVPTYITILQNGM